MADESLGHIDLRMITSGVTSGAVGDTGRVGAGVFSANAMSALQQSVASIGPTLKNIFGVLASIDHSVAGIVVAPRETSAKVVERVIREPRAAPEKVVERVVGGAAGGGGQNTVSAITQAMSKMSSALDVIRMGARGAGVGEIASSGIGLAAGAGVGGAALGGVAVGLGMVAAAALAIKSGVSAIQGRISELARVNAGMAQQEALNQIADIRRDMAEARVLGPLYAKVSEIMRSLKDAIQPFLILFKGLFTAIVIPLLNALVVRINELAKYIPVVLKMVISIFQTIAFTANLFSVFVAGLAQSFANLSGPLTGFSQGLSNIGFNMLTIVGALGQILNSLNNQQRAQNPNQWAINTLNALSSGGAVTPALVPVGPTMPGYNPTKPKVTP